MSEEGLGLQAALFIRQNLCQICCVIFIFLNWGYSFQALKAAFSLMFYRLLSSDQQEEIRVDFALQTNEVLASSVSAFIVVLLVGIFLAWFIDTIDIPIWRSRREMRHMRKFVRREMMLLTDMQALIMTLKHERAAREELSDCMKAAGEILQRYERDSRALKSHSLKRAKLSEKDKTVNDLFDEFAQAKTKTKAAPKAPSRKKMIKYRSRS